MFYLAAAVSDFYVPVSEMPEHKIQSSGGPLQVMGTSLSEICAPIIILGYFFLSWRWLFCISYVLGTGDTKINKTLLSHKDLTI